MVMPTYFGADDNLLREAQKLGGQKTKKATIVEALKEYIQRRKQMRILELVGKIDYDPKYNYKKQRRRR
jgi:Arc/MetJ family transcription regulator